MTNNTIPNVPRELLERAATSIEQRMCIQCEGVPCCMPESLNTLSDIRALLSDPSPAGVDADHVEDVRAMVAEPVQQVSVPDGFVLAKETVVEMPDGSKEIGYTTIGRVGIFNSAEEVFDAIRELDLPLGWVSMTTEQLLPGWMLAAAPAAPAAGVRCKCCGYLVTESEHKGCLRAAEPAADAGIVDMYRHLQKVTPYRFKKIQDASITDGGDVMYFHKDRFDAALLADMAAHCAAKGVV